MAGLAILDSEPGEHWRLDQLANEPDELRGLDRATVESGDLRNKGARSHVFKQAESPPGFIPCVELK